MLASASPSAIAGAPPRTLRVFGLARVLLGLLLLCAAGLKAYALWSGTGEPDPFFFSPRTEMAVIETEAVLGLWLVSGIYPRVSRQVAIVFFGLLASGSLYLALAGQASCGCFGQIHINPWITFALDVGAVALLCVLPMPDASSNHSSAWSAWPQFLGRTCFRAVVILMVVAIFFLLASDDPATALARLRGDSITIDPAVCDFGSAPFGRERSLYVRLTNRADRPIRIVGGSADCRCLAIRSLPIILSAGETQTIEVKATFRGSSGRFRHRYRLFTDDETHPIVVAHIGGQVAAAEE
jgi:Protein of unknown function (DUF1573)